MLDPLESEDEDQGDESIQAKLRRFAEQEDRGKANMKLKITDKFSSKDDQNEFLCHLLSNNDEDRKTLNKKKSLDIKQLYQTINDKKNSKFLESLINSKKK